MKNRPRYIFVIVMVALFGVLCVARLSSLQIIHGEENYKKSLSRTQRTVVQTAPRGEFYDRYGRLIVANRMGFTVEFQRVKGMRDDEINSIILKVNSILAANGDMPASDELPISAAAPYEFKFSTEEEALNWKKQFKIPEEYTASECIEYYTKEFNIEGVSESDRRTLVGVRYTMLIRGFGTSISYTLADDVSQDTVVSIKEHYDEYRGVNILSEPVREYPYGSMAVHILGRVAPINSTEYEALKEKGYNFNDSIGKEGLEKYLEDQLRGRSGKAVAEQDKDGHFVAFSEVDAAESGNSAFLTIDIDVQLAAEKAIKDTVADIYAHSSETKHGRDVAGAAAVAVDVNTGEIICIASYPDYDVTKYSKDYSKLLNDKNKPLFNRALAGTYSPGSTFKMLVGIAALENDVITPNTVIHDKVIYELGKSRFKCLHDHGDVNVSGAIKDSCNYFFYTVGYEMGIDKIVDCAKQFGLGEYSGIELKDEEAKGTIASPEEKAERNEPWYDGYTLQAAIGQDDNKFTPIQLASYVAQIANGGVRYTPHLIKGIYSYDTENVVSTTEITEAGRAEVGKEDMDAIRYGMRLVAEGGTAADYFKDYPIAVAAKTGTAEVYGGSDNGIFVAYAPYDNPQIAVAVVIERSGGGYYCGPVAKAIIDAYLNAENSPESTVGIDKLY